MPVLDSEAFILADRVDRAAVCTDYISWQGFLFVGARGSEGSDHFWQPCSQATWKSQFILDRLFLFALFGGKKIGTGNQISLYSF